MSEGLLDKKFILKRSNAVSLNYHLGERIYDTILKTELNNSEIVDELNKLDFENEELVKKYLQLKEDNEQLLKDVENLQEVVAELGATLLLNGFEIKINDENLSKLIDDE